MTTDTPNSTARFGPYSVRREIARGGMGVVFEAEDLAGIRVALKVPRIELRTDEQERARFLREMRLTAKLRHPNIVRILHGADDNGQLYLAMEYVEGISLRDELRQRSPLSLHDSMRIARQVAQALAAAHSQDPPIVHRDLTPGNVMLGTDGVVKVVDFGIAKAFDDTAAATTDPIGTLAYMSPEQLDGALSTPATDVHALGVIIYEMIVGTPPFPASLSPKDLIGKICSTAPISMSRAAGTTVPPDLDALVLRCLEKRAPERPQADAVANELARIENEILAGEELRSASRSPMVPMVQQQQSESPIERPPSRPLAATGEAGALDTVALIDRFEGRSRVRPVVLISGGVLLMASVIAYLALGDGDPSNRDDTIAVRANDEKADKGRDASEASDEASGPSGEASRGSSDASEESGGASRGGSDALEESGEAVIREDIPRSTSKRDEKDPRVVTRKIPQVRMAKATIKGTMDKDSIRRIVRAHINEVRYCYNQGLARDPDLKGRVSIQFNIGPTGSVPVAVVAESTVKDSNANNCIAKAVKRWAFPKPPEGGSAVVTQPFVLEPD